MLSSVPFPACIRRYASSSRSMHSFRLPASLTDQTLWRTTAYINGDWTSSPLTYTITDPATSRSIAEVSNLTASLTTCAIDAAAGSFKTWKKTTGRDRARILRKWHDLMIQHKEDLAMIMTAESGKPLAEARGEVDYSASYFEWFSEEAPRIYGDVIPSPIQDHRVLTMKQPIGVCFLITPWNFPLAMAARKIGAALAAGNTCLMKPAPETPLSALAMAELGERAGLPRGVFNVVPAGREGEGGWEDGVGGCEGWKVSFTGSTPVGKLLMAGCAKHVKRISLELGGNAPFIVFDDADIDSAVRGCISSKFRNAGQNLCQAEIKDGDGEVTEFRMGNGLRRVWMLDRLSRETGWRKLKDLSRMLLAKGGMVDVFGKRIFGPVASVFKFTTEEEVLERSNSSDVWVSWGMEVGMVGVNEGMISSAVAPFGGVKMSGMGREGSMYGVEDYVEVKEGALEVAAGYTKS
ncbi:Aldehyde/histidinol dehydrogenase [Chytridium lagenaria]|nr:Aldehyde/histidinol dehydrogenase [Chytridium lagenaria]